MAKHQIAVLRGDGIGPEVVEEGLKVLKAAASAEGVSLAFHEYPFGAEYYLKHKEVLPDSAVSEFKGSSAIYFGSVGDPRIAPGILEHGLIINLRFLLDEYVNLRPARLRPNVNCPVKGVENLDIYVVRENTEDFYTRMGNIYRNGEGVNGHCNLTRVNGLYTAKFDVKSAFSTDDDYAFNIGLISRKGASRVMRYAFDLAVRKGKKRVTSVDKSNAIPQIYSLWDEEFRKVAAQYPGIEADHAFGDAVAMWLVKSPQQYGVMVAPNLLGDILSDEAAIVSGGLGFAPGGNINPEGVSMFEAIGGSAPKYAGKNVINPIATILAGAMMMETLGEDGMAKRIDDAVDAVLASGAVCTRDMGGTTKTNEVGDKIVQQILSVK